mgnify:CR=1 FL=1
MIVRLFDIENSNLVITEHCHALPFLKKIMEEEFENGLNIKGTIEIILNAFQKLTPFILSNKNSCVFLNSRKYKTDPNKIA